MGNNVDNLALWEEYASTREPSIREELIIKYAHIVKYIAGRLSIYFGTNVEYDDLIGYGVLGLIDAIDKFDLKKGVKFESYASLRIRGSIIDSIRSMDWVPRSLRQKSKAIEKAYWELECELGHSVTDEEVAKKMGISLEKFSRLIRDVNISTVLSLDEVLEQNFENAIKNSNTGKTERPESYLSIIEVKSMLVKAIKDLPPKERKVIALYYYENLTLREISSVMEVSESRVSQLHTKAISHLSVKLAKDRTLLFS